MVMVQIDKICMERTAHKHCHDSVSSRYRSFHFASEPFCVVKWRQYFT